MKKFFKQPWYLIVFYIISTIILLIYSLGYEKAIEWVKYFTYLYSTYSLIVVIVNLKRFHLFLKNKMINTNTYKNIKSLLYKNKTIEKYFTDKKFMNLINLNLSTIINFIFIFLKFRDGVVYKSSWFISLSIYYLILTITKIFLLRKLNENKDIKYEYAVYRSTGYLLMALNLILAGMTIQMIIKDVSQVYEGNIIFASAFYSFYLIITAIINMFKYRKYNSPILSSVKTINLFTALVSILMLQTTMIATFSVDNYMEYMQLMNTLTGSGVLLIILTISTYMIIKGTKVIKN